MGSQPRGAGAGTSGSPGAPSSPASFPSLRGSPLSRPRARGNGDPQPLGRQKSHPPRQPLTTADRAVATDLVAPARCFSLAGPSRLRHGGFPRPEMGRRGARQRSRVETPLGGRGGKRGKANARVGAELCQLLPPPPGPRAGPLRAEALEAV